MTQDQIILFSLLGGVFALLISGKVRYDLVAFSALVVGILTGVVPEEHAFDGFGHHATMIIALVLIVSRGLMNSGAVDLITRAVLSAGKTLPRHIGLMSALAAALSTVMNNVGALAVLMPVDIQAASKAKRSPSLSLMPISFASILGGLVTLIGTPPNIIIAGYRKEALGESYALLDFAPVGLAASVAGVLFITLIGWRLIPAARVSHDASKNRFNIDEYVAELKVNEDSGIVGKQLAELDDLADEAGISVVGLVRRGKRFPGAARRQIIRANDVLVIEAPATAIDEFVGVAGLAYFGEEQHEGLLSEGVSLMEVVVPVGARIDGRSALSVKLLYRHGITLLGVSRQGKKIVERVRKLTILPGDVLLLLGPAERLETISQWLGCLPLKARDAKVIQRSKAGIAVALFGSVIGLAAFSVISLPLALAIACVGMVGFGIVPVRDIYTTIEWPVVVLLGSMIPIGAALETSGSTGMIANFLVDVTEGYGPLVVLTLLMVVTMTLSDVLNNTATAVIAAPIAVDIANRLSVSPDPFLMAVAVAASCAFLTPIGHKNNTLILGPGGYHFGDYWRMGLPLEIIVITVSVPMIAWVWPF